jgi:hypothetical protein
VLLRPRQADVEEASLLGEAAAVERLVELVALALALLLETAEDGARDLAQKMGPHLPPGGQRVAADDLVRDLVHDANPDA